LFVTPLMLNPVEVRVIGSLAEKQLTTPQQYPLTLNALVLACNQASNRDPVVSFDDATVEIALASLKEAGVVRFVHPSHGRSVMRYRQVVDERFGLDERGLSMLSVLLLRGPQTAAEMRARTERAAVFDGVADAERELQRLSDLPEPLVRRLPRQPGQKEERWVQLLSGEPALETAEAPWVARPARTTEPTAAEYAASLRAEVDALREEVATLRVALEALQSALGD
jgi:uncharacterized protein YceH (UPF0502 family)